MATAIALLVGCAPKTLQVPEADVRPAIVDHGSHVSLRMWGSEIADYRFMGAVPGPDGYWIIRLDPVYLGVWNQPAQVAVRPGDIVTLGSSPTVRVQFVEIRSTQLRLRAVGIETPAHRY